MQGIALALLLGLLVGFVAGYFLQKGRVNQLNEDLHQSREQLSRTEHDHERRLREATQVLQNDYEKQLAEKIERYQDQLEERLALMEKEYEGRLSLASQSQQHSSTSSSASALAENVSQESTPRLLMEETIKQRYELRLKEAARKIQQAYEQHLRRKLRTFKDELQHEYEERMAQKVEHYEEQISQRLQSLGEAAETRGLPLGIDPLGPEPGMASQAGGKEMASEEILLLKNQLKEEYEHKLAKKIEQYQADLAQRIEQLEAQYEARLRATQPPASQQAPESDDLDALLREEYEQKLAEKIEHYQDSFNRRMQDMEQEYEARLQLRLQPQTQQAQEQAEQPTPNSPVSNPLIPDRKKSAASQGSSLAANPVEELWRRRLLNETPVNDSTSPEMFALDEVLSMEHAPSLGEELDLGSTDTLEGDLNLDELLFEGHNSERSTDDLDLDNLNNLS